MNEIRSHPKVDSHADDAHVGHAPVPAHAAHSSSKAAMTRLSAVSGVGLGYLLLMNAVVAGLEIAASVAFTYAPPLLLKSGFGETQMSIIFGIAPFLALATVPYMGKWSDRCRSPIGRRKPFILGLSVVLILSLLLLTLGQNLLHNGTTRCVGATILAVSIILLDYSSQAAINPCEALMADTLHKSAAPETGYKVYSGMLSFGSCIGYLLSAIDWAAFTVFFGGNEEQVAFMIVLVLFVITLAITMVVAKDSARHTDDDSDDEDDGEEATDVVIANNNHLGKPNGDVSSASQSKFDPLPILPPLDDRLLQIWCQKRGSERRVSTSPNFFFNKIKQIVLCCIQIVYLPLEMIMSIVHSPLILRRLFVADLFSWMGIMVHAMFCTDFVATVVYGGKPDADVDSLEFHNFNAGVRMGSWGLLLHSITACIYAGLVQDTLTQLIGLKWTYILGLGTFATSMLFTVLFNHVAVLNVCAAISGVGFAVITTIPNTLVTLYHTTPELFFKGRPKSGGYGEDIAVLDSGYYLSQIVLSLFMGKLVEMTGMPQLYIVAATIFGFTATVFAMRVVFRAEDMKLLRDPCCSRPQL